MQRRSLIRAVGAAAIASNGATAWAGSPEVPLPRIGAPLALTDVPLFDGSTFRAAEAQGQVTVVYWWASWCPFCAIQTPMMQKLWDAQRARGLRMLGLSIDRQVEDARKYIGQRGYTFPTGFNTPAIQAVLPKPSKGLPVTLVRGRDGRVVTAEAGQLFPEDIEQIGRLL